MGQAEMRASISVIIPALNEEQAIGGTIQNLEGSDIDELIVVDGGSSDRTTEIAEALGAQVVHGPANRGCQQNLGAQRAKGSALLFLHADTVLSTGFADQVRTVLAKPGTSAGAFRFRLDAPGWKMRLIEKVVAMRCRAFGMPYGDQAIFMSRAAFDQAGQFAELPVMEDFDLVRRLRRLGTISLADGTATTSARRWRREGVWRVTLRHQLCILGYYVGIPAHRLELWRNSTPWTDLRP